MAITGTDVSFIRRNGSKFCDIVIEGNDVKTGDELYTAVYIALFTDARATTQDMSTYGKNITLSARYPFIKRGWWGDTYRQSGSLGSKLWLNKRQKTTELVLSNHIRFVRESLQPLVTKGMISKVNVQGRWSAINTMEMSIEIIRPTGDPSSFTFQYMWDGLQ